MCSLGTIQVNKGLHPGDWGVVCSEVQWNCVWGILIWILDPKGDPSHET